MPTLRATASILKTMTAAVRLSGRRTGWPTILLSTVSTMNPNPATPVSISATLALPPRILCAPGHQLCNRAVWFDSAVRFYPSPTLGETHTGALRFRRLPTFTTPSPCHTSRRGSTCRTILTRGCLHPLPSSAMPPAGGRPRSALCCALLTALQVLQMRQPPVHCDCAVQRPWMEQQCL